LFGFVCLFLAVLPFQWKRHYFLRLDGQVLEKWEGWPFCSVQQRIHLGEIESVDVETVIPSSSRHTKEYLAFVLRPKSFTHQEIVHIPLPVGSEEHASEVFLHALRQVIKKRMSFFERRRCLEKVFIPQQGCFRILFALSSSSVFFDEVNKVCEHRMTYCWSLAMWTSWPAAWPAFSLW
jgi:hypothetical protein